MTRQKMLRKLRLWEACDEGMAWVRSTPATSFAELWPLFDRADWMLWLYVRVRPDDRIGRVALALDCAETALPIYERRYPNDMRVRDCIAMGRRWCEGKATDGELLGADALAAYAADDAACAAADAAYAAADAADAADADAARKSAHLAMCALIRKRVPTLEDK